MSCKKDQPCCYLKNEMNSGRPYTGLNAYKVKSVHSTKVPPMGMRSAIPLGGVATGNIELRADGTFHEWTIANQNPAGIRCYEFYEHDSRFCQIWSTRGDCFSHQDNGSRSRTKPYNNSILKNSSSSLLSSRSLWPRLSWQLSCHQAVYSSREQSLWCSYRCVCFYCLLMV